MSKKTKKILGIIIFLMIGFRVIMFLQLTPHLQRAFVGRLIQVQEDYIKQGGELAYDTFEITPTVFGSAKVTCQRCVFSSPDKRLKFSTPKVDVSWTIFRPNKLSITFPEEGIFDLCRIGSVCFGKKTRLTLPISWKNMRPQIALFLSGSVYLSTDKIETHKPGKFITFKGEDVFLALQSRNKPVTSADGIVHKENVLHGEMSIKHLGSYLGQFLIFEFDTHIKAFLTHPKILFEGIPTWKEAGGYIECEDAGIQMKDLKMQLNGSLTLASSGIPEEGAFILEIAREGGILEGLKEWSFFLPRKINNTGKCGDRARIPITLHAHNWFIDDLLFFDWKERSYKNEALEHALSELENGNFTF
ncbi:MAG: DUF2125 domain-containing protein [Holosporales bacterium]|jgi:hypothetical protein|nr:DUF2125 domain-containing protein [Holosporales bacterium]